MRKENGSGNVKEISEASPPPPRAFPQQMPRIPEMNSDTALTTILIEQRQLHHRQMGELQMQTGLVLSELVAIANEALAASSEEEKSLLQERLREVTSRMRVVNL